MVKTALLIVDVQNVFHPMVTAAIPRSKNSTTSYSESLAQCCSPNTAIQKKNSRHPIKNQLVRRWGPDGSIHKGNKDWELIPSIKKLVKDSPAVAKNTYDAFINTDLDDLLQERGVERLVACGVMTDCCCNTTARSAFNRGYEAWLISDACGSANKKQREAGLAGFDFMCDGVMTTAIAISKLEKV